MLEHASFGRRLASNYQENEVGWTTEDGVIEILVSTV